VTYKSFDLTGKSVLITGASRGIGAAAALALGAAGAGVMLMARDGRLAARVAGQVVAAGGVADAVACDVTDYEALERVVAATKRRFGSLDVLVNNAGVIEPIGMLADTDPAVWARSIETNLVAAYYAIRAVLPEMVAAGGGTIVNVSWGAGGRPLAGWSAYCAGKAGLHMLTRSVALEYGNKGIRVFGFQPGTTDTDMHVAIRASGLNPISKIPREQLTPVTLPAAAIVYLCSPAAEDLAGHEFSLKDEAFRSRLGR